ncbi:ABC1 kinase family protein [Haloglycomyces albus]|uniref:ABC1 kinase family protein n=1 Tax=Haloglycomyces albus TaxID=526067 RepID=UPI00046D6C8D|nr:AarF/ABC1/UbiB kinase family protein [Haloglycomyces albus]
MSENDHPDSKNSRLPERALSRGFKLASLPLGLAGRATVGMGKRITGFADEILGEDVQRKTADHLFRVLGQLKGGAMKLGQAMSIFEAALPEHLAKPYRDALTKLQNSAPPLPAESVHGVLHHNLGEDWRGFFREFNDQPAAAASIGQVHRAIWHDGTEVAVKIQYPGAGKALQSDLKQLTRIAPLFKTLQPNFDVKAIIQELQERILEELDYEYEAEAQRTFVSEFQEDDQLLVPDVRYSTSEVLVTEWVEGTPLAEIIKNGTPSERDSAGWALATFHFSAPARTGLLHADPHPGNFAVADDGRLIAYDFGAVARLPDGIPPQIGRLTSLTLHERGDEVVAGLREEGFIPSDLDITSDEILHYLTPMLEPLRGGEFTFDRDWLRNESSRLTSSGSHAARVGKQLSFPPDYLLIHRVTLGSIGVLCQLEATGDWNDIVRQWVPGFDYPALSRHLYS